MSDLRQQIRDHYAARSLSSGRVAAILAQGRAAGAGAGGSRSGPARVFWQSRAGLALAAAVFLLAGLGVFYFSGGLRADYAKLRPAIVAFFAEEPDFPKMSEQPEELREWVIARGAPARFRIPARLLQLDSKACAILKVEKKPAYLLCFLKQDKEGRRNGGMVHLVVARRQDFGNLPPAGAPAIHTAGRWSFASWTEGEVLYTVATPAPVGELRGYLARNTSPASGILNGRSDLAVAFQKAAGWRAR